MYIIKATKQLLWPKCVGTCHGDISEVFKCPRCKECLCDHKEQPNYAGWICKDRYKLWIYLEGGSTNYIPGSKPQN